MQTESVEWVAKIRKLLRATELSQLELAQRVGVSAATVSRWLSRRHQPTPQNYVALGNLAAPPDDVYFWERAGVQLKHPNDVPLKRVASSAQLSANQLRDFRAKKRSGLAEEDQPLVAIPLLGVCAYADEHPPAENISLARAEVEEIITAPLSWCPHPDNLVGMHVCGDSMFPTIQKDAIAIIDLSATERRALNHQLCLVSHRDLGFKVARLQHLGRCYVLVPANSACNPTDITNPAEWQVMGRVLWWVSRDTPSQSDGDQIGLHSLTRGHDRK